MIANVCPESIDEVFAFVPSMKVCISASSPGSEACFLDSCVCIFSVFISNSYEKANEFVFFCFLLSKFVQGRKDKISQPLEEALAKLSKIKRST